MDSGQELVNSGPKHAFWRVCGAHAPDSNARKTLYIVPVGMSYRCTAARAG
jgi:hypothetical protein